MTIEKIIKYILHTPHNTHKAILREMLEQLILEHGGTLPDGPGGDDPKDVIYDGGVEQ